MSIITVRGPNGDVVTEGTTVMLVCSLTSYPQSTISWEKVTSSGSVDLTSRAPSTQHTHDTFSTTSTSSINITNADINELSRFCCAANNDVGAASRCSNDYKAETGKL